MAHCKAHSSRTGLPCRAHAIAGAAVCRKHGGAAPQVKRKAQERLAILVDPAIGRMAELLNADSEAVRLATVNSILDRNGLKPVKQIEQTTYDVNEVESLECLTDEELDWLIRIQRKIAESVKTPVAPESAEKNGPLCGHQS